MRGLATFQIPCEIKYFSHRQTRECATRDERDDLVTSQYCAREKWRDLVREWSTTK